MAFPLPQRLNIWTVKFMYITFKYSVRTSQETRHLRYKAQPVNAVYGNYRCLL
jgi:hypothetical protein